MESQVYLDKCLGYGENHRTDVTDWSQIFALHKKTINDYLVGLGGGSIRESTEDLVQEVFFRAYRGWSSFRRECSIKTWLLGIARNVYREFCRNTSRRPRISSLDTIEEVAQEKSYDFDRVLDLLRHRDQVERAMCELTVRQYVAIYLVLIEEYPIKDAARMVESSVKLIEHRICSGLNRLRRFLAACPVEYCPNNSPIPTTCPARCGMQTCLKYEILKTLGTSKKAAG